MTINKYIMKLKPSYLNVILTVIAFGVITLCLQNANVIKPLKPHKVIVQDVYGTMDVNIESCNTTIPIEGEVDANIEH